MFSVFILHVIDRLFCGDCIGVRGGGSGDGNDVCIVYMFLRFERMDKWHILTLIYTDIVLL